MMTNNNIIFTNTARCRDCYRCVRECPVNAIKYKNDQASVIIENCILCGTCIKECPQNAKSYRDDVSHAKKLLKENSNVVVSVAPSFAAFYPDFEQKRIPSSLRALGFSAVYETAEGAFHVAHKTAALYHEGKRTQYATACPSFVNFIEKYEDKHLGNLAKVVSPMIAHSKILKKRHGDNSKIIFIGPCIAKKGEAERSEIQGLVDCVLTFEELNKWVSDENINIDYLEESEFDNLPTRNASLFPLLGGLTKTAEMSSDMLADKTLSVSGIGEIREAIYFAENSSEPLLIEPLVCKTGCINGPGTDCKTDLFTRRQNVLTYSRKDIKDSDQNEFECLDFSTSFSREMLPIKNGFSDQEIEAIFEQTGKAKPEDQLNCGACGYDNCNDNAIAVLNGMAEPEMCIPFMRRQAEQRGDKILESSPNGIVIVDEHFKILHMNKSFKKFFTCSNTLLGKNVSELMDPEPFIKLKSESNRNHEFTISHSNYNIICHQILYKLKDVEQYVCVFVDITRSVNNREQLDKLKHKTVMQAEELMNHQIEMAQKLTKFLGESTARGEELVENLMELSGDHEKKNKLSNNGWLWDIYTSK